MKSIDIAIAIILYNPSIEDLDRIKKYSEIFDTILLIDNSDKYEDECKEYLKILIQEYKGCKYYSMGGNAGISVALNKAFEVAIQLEKEFILTMDQDSDFPNEDILCMERIIQNDNDETIAIYCPNFRKIYWKHDLQEKVYGKIAIPQDKCRFVTRAMTSGSFVRVKCVEKVIPLTDLFIALVDDELSYRLCEKGYRIKAIGEVILNQQVGHKVEATWYNEFFHIVKHDSLRSYYTVRNIFFVLQEIGDNRKQKSVYIFLLFRSLFNVIMGEEKKIEKLRYAWRGYKDYRRGVLGKYCDR